MTLNFGNYAILDPVVHHFEQEPDWWWKIKPADSGAELEMSKFLMHNRVFIRPDGTRVDLVPTNLEIAIQEIALTFGGTNIPKDPKAKVEDGGDPIIPVGTTTEQIKAILVRMPHAMLMEIWDAVGEANPEWGPDKGSKK